MCVHSKRNSDTVECTQGYTWEPKDLSCCPFSASNFSDDVWSGGEFTFVKNRQLDLRFLTGPFKTKFLWIKYSEGIGFKIKSQVNSSLLVTKFKCWILGVFLPQTNLFTDLGHLEAPHHLWVRSIVCLESTQWVLSLSCLTSGGGACTWAFLVENIVTPVKSIFTYKITWLAFLYLPRFLR